MGKEFKIKFFTGGKLGVYLHSFLNNKKILKAIVVCLILFFVFSFLLMRDFSPEKIWISLKQDFFSFTFGSFQSIVAALIISWCAYQYRVEIRNFFQPQIIYISAPLMLGVAPLIIARSDNRAFWERHGLNMDLDFRYAGRDSLKELYNDDSRYPIAVASDIALCSHYGKNLFEGEDKPVIIPFVSIKGNIKLIVRKQSGNEQELEYKDIKSLNGRKIGYYENSVQEDFLIHHGINKINMINMEYSTLGFYSSLKKGDIDAFVLWEPHYYAFMNYEVNNHTTNKDKHNTTIPTDVGILDIDGGEYIWFLCLAVKQKFMNINENICKRILSAIKETVLYCQKHKQDISDYCSSYLLTEFTGISEDALKHLVSLDCHSFDMVKNIQLFLSKMHELQTRKDDIGIGAGHLKECLWNGLIV